MKIKFAIPKGSLEVSTLELLKKSWTKVNHRHRTYRVFLDDPEIEIKMLRPQEIPLLISEGLYDIGITGKDWIEETKANVRTMLDLEYGKIKLVVAIPRNNQLKSLDDMINNYFNQNKILRISSEYLTATAKFIKKSMSYQKNYGSEDPLIITPWIHFGKNKNVQIHLSFGATEAKPPDDVDIIIDVTETGTTMEKNGLKIIHTILESSAHVIVNKQSLSDNLKYEKISDMLTLMKGAVNSNKYLHIYLNIHKKNLGKLLDKLPSLKKPTICNLSEQDWYSVNTIIPKDDLHKLIPIIRKVAQGLVIHEPKQILELE